MARAKKEAALTPEERLQAALVPDWEWPYQLPENWCWTTCKRITSRISDGSHNPPKDSGQGIPLLSATNIHDGIIDFENVSRWITEKEWVAENSRTNIEFGDVLLTIVATLGRTAVVDTSEKFALQRSVAVLKPRINSKYLAYCLDMPYIQSFISDNAKGTAQKGFYLNSVENIYIPLAPLSEQQRIVDRIESLFAKLDEAKEKAQTVLDSFETRKAAILHKAFTGELTAKWRKSHGVGMERWKTQRFDEVAVIRSNLVDPADYQDYPHIAPDSIEKKTGVLLEYHTIYEDKVTSGKHRFYSGQILYSKIRPYLSKVVVVGFDGLCSADMYPIEAVKNTKCLWYYMLSEEFLLQASSAGSRSVLPKINQKELSALTVHLPTEEDEQIEIVRILDGLFAKEQQAKEAAEAVLEKIDLMKKAILARAFRGELGTNVPNDEPAVELLKKII